MTHQTSLIKSLIIWIIERLIALNSFALVVSLVFTALVEFQCSGPCFSFLSCVFISHRIVLSMLSSNMVLLTLASYSWRMWREFSTLNHTDYFYCYKNNAELRARLLDPFHRPLPSCQFMLWAAVPPLDQWSTLISWKELSQGLPLFPTCILFFFFFSADILFSECSTICLVSCTNDVLP